jgi:hypothetical protein
MVANRLPMPVTWTIDAKKKMTRIVCGGDVTRADLHALMDAYLDEVALGYRTLVDVREASTSMTSEEMLDVGVRARSIQALGKSGPLAMVLPQQGLAEAETLLGMVSVGQPVMRIFRDMAAAEDWIKRQSARPNQTDPESAPA